MLTDPAMKDRLQKISAHMQAKSGPEKAADLLISLAEGTK
jgi:UDP:flavonoid glycosyltransferase YjiC (YdhE family)